MGSRCEEVDASVSGGQEVVVHPFPPFGRSMCAETGGLAVADASEREREKERERHAQTHGILPRSGRPLVVVRDPPTLLRSSKGRFLFGRELPLVEMARAQGGFLVLGWTRHACLMV